MTNTAKQLTCADRVHEAKESRLEDIRSMLFLEEDDISLGDHGTLDTVINVGTLEPIIYSADYTDAYRDEAGVFDLDCFIDDHIDEIQEYANDQFDGYILGIDYVEPETFEGQDEGYIRVQISYGGPSEEIRYFVSPTTSDNYYAVRPEWHLHSAEFWYLDWFDGACVPVTSDDRARMLFDYLNDCGVIDSAITNE